MKVILTSSGKLITDYMEIANPGAALFNSGLMTILSILLARFVKSSVSGPLIAAIFIVSGFSFFGKNIFNTIPITIGVFLYARFIKMPLKSFLLACLFGSCLGPLVSEIAFSLGFGGFKAILIAYIVGIFVGFLIPPLSQSFLRFHQGFCLYNVGFTAGIIGMFIAATLKTFDINIETVNYIYDGSDLYLKIILFISFFIMAVAGFIYTENLGESYNNLMKNTGQLVADFLEIYGGRVTLFNMGIMGIISLFFIIIFGGKLSGPVIGGILTIVGFSAFGKHPKNTIPILLGARFASNVNIYDKNSASSIMIMLFATNLAPIAGKYGFVAGLIAGFIHVGVVSNLAFLHGGLNLYNNGFAGGFVAGALVPIFDSLVLSFRRWKNNARL